ncbi:MAG: hypothetical protein A2271_00740 [Candidatus Moranbacteria bacterium RIFOXYA12_FULL_35_19]|nr:MAG: Membrane protein [Candidatus Moranbacteria bacterium GW2011_GWF2_35_39]OGI32055.1 MAG: hypothetical protein A2343_01710 [Candidatus Moranbacteria bacterium RIFOXYB12_FULL_35_8]OGI32247.1 MAG: hypothetical protein A2489_02820 [Candidatus Moranbacteria bacterium RIFOXYC12_FULL_36_13]OGI35890.1 MAG: hypothetical protein A2271_00740 [Candidatus Moranbacteria bacterium RIFOXYA12_FULL_35_19]
MTKEIILIIIVVIWTLPWKGFALWKSARKGDSVWFVFLLLINTLAILEILYIFIFSERKVSKKTLPK